MDAGEDCISGLPDELLHAILVRLGSTRAAACTGVLSRRWRHVWASLPELVLEEERVDAPPREASFLDTVDAALAAYDAPSLERLIIALYARDGGGVLAGRIEPWLRFASERVVGELFLLLPPQMLPFPEPEEAAVLELPASGVTSMDLGLGGPWRLRPPSSGLFGKLTNLVISFARMEGSDLTALVCTQCPCLKDLTLFIMLVDTSDLSIRSESLQSLCFSVWKTRRLEIVAPRLEKLYVSITIDEARISAPKLAELSWFNATYDRQCHHFDDVGHRLRLLELHPNSTMVSPMQQFDEVDELKLNIYIPQGIDGYESFLNATNKLPKCKTLTISAAWEHHSLAQSMLHLLRSCNSMRKLSLFDRCDSALKHPCLPSCPCGLDLSHRIDAISLNSLEEVEITSYASPHEVLEFVELLSKCNAPILKKVVMKHKMNSAPPPTKEVREKICRMFQPNIEVELYVFSDWKWVRTA